MNIPETVWKACMAEQARLRSFEAAARVALKDGSTAYIRADRRRSVVKRRVRRLELLLVRAYRRVLKMRASLQASQDASGDGQAGHGSEGAQEAMS